MAHSSSQSLSQAVEQRRGVYHSRSRGVWVKGETSGATQDLIAIDLDCDRDALRFTVRQHEPGFCHTGDRSCWGEDHGLERLQRRIGRIASSDDPSSNTRKLLADGGLLSAKLVEEAAELGAATGPDQVTHEAADLLYFLLVRAAAAGVGLEEIEAELDRRERKVTRRPMTAKGAE
jgi:phosphoribosyl-ATP pyrophosphohydrolase